jgi:ABC-2 type transport system permease protein
MAGLTELSGKPTGAIPAAQQFGAVAYLRWCLFRNGFRRKGGAGELAARIIVFPIALGFVVGPAIAAFALSLSAAHANHLSYLLPIFWGIFALQILVSINVSPPGLSFDPESLIRFPVTFTRYLIIRLFLGLLSASTIVGTTALLAAAAGVTVAIPTLALPAFIAVLALAICNMLFIRMIFAWIDRWLSTRRAREFFTFFIIAISLGFQYINITLNGFGRHHRPEQAAKIAAAIRFYHHIQPILAALPPGQAASAIIHASANATGSAALNIFAILVGAAIFKSVFAWRMLREYRGENLSEVSRSQPTPAPAALPRASSAQATHTASLAPLAANSQPASTLPFGLSTEIVGAFQKEWIYVRRNPAQMYGLLVPFAMVFIFAARTNTFASASRADWIFPAAIAYSLLGMSQLAYNALGLDAAGVQFYFMAPVRMRTIFIAKNLFGFLINIVQIALVYVVLSFTSGAPSPLVTVMTICWVIFAALANITVANMRSITSPKKVDPSKLSRKQASQLSALICMGVIFVAGGIGAGLIAVGHFTGMPWLPIPILLLFDLGAFALYRASLDRIDAMVLNHRDSLLEELTKASI